MQTQNEETAVEAQAGTPTEQEQAQQPASEVSTEPGAEQTAEHVEQQSQEQQKPKNDWVQRRIDQLTREKHEAIRRAEAAEARGREQGDGQHSNTQQRQPTDIDAAVEARLREREFNSACNKVFEAGKSEFASEWDSSLRTFAMLGGAPNEFLDAITSMENGHKVLHALGQDPEAAERVLSLPPLRMALELARIETKVGQAKPQSVSKAPPPINPIGGRSAPVEPAEFATTAEQIAYWKKHGSN
jgi:hypothetical protein